MMTTIRYFKLAVARIEQKLDLLLKQQGKEMATIQDIKARTEAQTGVINSAVTLLNGLHQMLKDALASGDPAAIQAVLDELDANTAALATAVQANTTA